MGDGHCPAVELCQGRPWPRLSVTVIGGGHLLLLQLPLVWHYPVMVLEGAIISLMPQTIFHSVHVLQKSGYIMTKGSLKGPAVRGIFIAQGVTLSGLIRGGIAVWGEGTVQIGVVPACP